MRTTPGKMDREELTMKRDPKHERDAQPSGLRPPHIEPPQEAPVRRPMSVGANTDRFLPAWVGSIRFRLALLYSVLLFGLAAVALGGFYAAISRELNDAVATDATTLLAGGSTGDVVLQDLEAEVDRRVLRELRQYSFWALGALFVSSLAVGWYVAGLVLAPIERITAVARSISARDLNRRIKLSGPDDELGQLAGTFDDMLDRLDLAFRAQVRFIHEASHELRNPLAVIRTTLDVTLSDPGATKEDLERSGRVISKSADRMSVLVDDLLLHAREESLDTRVERVDLDHVITSSVEEFAITAAAEDLTLVARSQPGLVVEGDPVALRRALANLLANAIRLAPKKSSISVRSGSIDGWAWMGVEDEGPGLSKQDQQRAFRRFWRGDSSAAPRKDGRSGLGLAIVKQIAESHGGAVRVESELGEGATFVVWLPQAGQDASGEQLIGEAQPHAESDPE